MKTLRISDEIDQDLTEDDEENEENIGFPDCETCDLRYECEDFMSPEPDPEGIDIDDI